MKEIIRLGVILAIISAVAAGALAYTNQVTSAIIAERIRQETIAQLQELFPTLDNFETKEVNGRTGTVAYDANGNFVGVLAEGTTEGYAGTIRFNLGVNGEGKIVALTIISHSETPGLGAKIDEESYRQQFVGKGAGDSFDVDNISGATVSCRAMESGVEKELTEILLAFTGEGGSAPAPSFSMDGVADGTYTGTAKGFLADVAVEVTVAGGKITAVTVTEQNDTPEKFDEAEDHVIKQIIEKQTVQVDAASGATVSSDAIMKAVQNALAQ
jgi:electron transport complex protein RnfG